MLQACGLFLNLEMTLLHCKPTELKPLGVEAKNKFLFKLLFVEIPTFNRASLLPSKYGKETQKQDRVLLLVKLGNV